MAVPRFGCSSFFAVEEPFDRRAWAYAMLYMNLYGLQLLYSSHKFRIRDRYHDLYVGMGVVDCTIGKGERTSKLS